MAVGLVDKDMRFLTLVLAFVIPCSESLNKPELPVEDYGDNLTRMM